MPKNTIRVAELFAGVGGFRIGLEGASDAYETIWNNQWEPSTIHQDASLVYRARFGSKGHSNKDINLVATTEIPAKMVRGLQKHHKQVHTQILLLPELILVSKTSTLLLIIIKRRQTLIIQK